MEKREQKPKRKRKVKVDKKPIVRATPKREITTSKEKREL